MGSIGFCWVAFWAAAGRTTDIKMKMQTEAVDRSGYILLVMAIDRERIRKSCSSRADHWAVGVEMAVIMCLDGRTALARAAE